MSESPSGEMQVSGSPSPEPDCHVCTYYTDRLDDDSGASDGERDAVLRERHRHERMYHPERHGSGLRVPR